MPRRISTLLGGALLALGVAAVVAASVIGFSGSAGGNALGLTASQPGARAGGVDDDHCRPAEGQRPVVVLPGTGRTVADMSELTGALALAGRCVFGMDYGAEHQGPSGSSPGVTTAATGDIAASARDVGRRLAELRARLGVDRVDVVAHSQGGLVLRELLATDPAAAQGIATVVTLGATHHGTTFAGLQELVAVRTGGRLSDVAHADDTLGVAARQQIRGSEFLRRLDTHPDTVAGVHYVVLASRDDTITTPWRSTFLTAVPGARVTNLEVHEQCHTSAPISHDGLHRDPAPLALVTWALASDGGVTTPPPTHC